MYEKEGEGKVNGHPNRATHIFRATCGGEGYLCFEAVAREARALRLEVCFKG